MQRRRNVPGQSRPAAFLAADTRPSTLPGAGVCADPTATPAMTASAVPMAIACNFMLFLLCAERLSALFGELYSEGCGEDIMKVVVDLSVCNLHGLCIETA